MTAFGLLFCLLPTLASASAVKGVRGTRKLQEPVALKGDKVKKCKKFKEPKAGPKGVADPKASDPKLAAADKTGEAPAPKDGPIPEEAVAPKATPELKDPKAKKEDPKAAARAEELECLEWEEDRADGGSSGVIDDPAFGSSNEFQSVNVDCDAIANDKGPKDTHSLSFMINMDVLKDADASLQDIYSAMEKELQTKVAPRVAGCSRGRMLASGGSSKIVNVDFGEMELDRKGALQTIVVRFLTSFSFPSNPSTTYFFPSRLCLCSRQGIRRNLLLYGCPRGCIFCW